MHNSARLTKGRDRCTALIHPADAAVRGIGDGDRVRVRSRVGEIVVAGRDHRRRDAGRRERARTGSGTTVPASGGATRPAIGGASVNDVTDATRYDPISGNAAVNAVPVAVERLEDATGLIPSP